MLYLKEQAYFFARRSSMLSRDRRLSVVAAGLEASFSNPGARKGKGPLTGIEKILAKTGNSGLLKAGTAWWQAYIDAIDLPESEFESAERTLLAITTKLPQQRLTATEWLELYRICLLSGLYVVGLQCREKAETAAISEAFANSSSISALRKGLAVAFERNSGKEISLLLEHLKKAGEQPLKLAHAQWLNDVLFHGARAAFLMDADSNPQTIELSRALQGRTVALVGPVPSHVDHGENIDAFDLVAKFNFRGGQLGRDPLTQGSRVDISYYNIQQSKYIARKLNPSFLSEVPFPVFIKDKGLRLVRKHAPTGRVLLNLQWLLFDSEFNAGPNAIYDLLRFSPACIKVFNTDLMLTAGRFKGYSRPGGEEINYSHSFAKTHDPVMQFRWTQRAWEKGLIEGDDRFQEVMTLTEPEYIQRLQDGHGAIARKSLRGS